MSLRQPACLYCAPPYLFFWRVSPLPPPDLDFGFRSPTQSGPYGILLPTASGPPELEPSLSLSSLILLDAFPRVVVWDDVFSKLPSVPLAILVDFLFPPPPSVGCFPVLRSSSKVAAPIPKPSPPPTLCLFIPQSPGEEGFSFSSFLRGGFPLLRPWTTSLVVCDPASRHPV